MVDIKLRNGDIVLTPAGSFAVLSGGAARLQGAKNALNIRRGSFIYDRELGSRLEEITGSDDYAKYSARLAAMEALAPREKVRAEILTVGDSLTVRLSADGETEETEVHFYGNVQ